MTGITRVSIASYEALESIFSDLNNLEVVTTTSDKYATAFGFTEEEVFDALDECGLSGERELVKRWYDGFVFGQHKDIYNPWSILNFLGKRKVGAYWANTSSNSLVGNLLREGNRQVKEQFEELLSGESIWVPVDEQIVYSLLGQDDAAIWSLLLAGGYLKALNRECEELVERGRNARYELMLTNYEVVRMFDGMVLGCFGKAGADDAMILEFKVHDSADEVTLADTVAAALKQIEEKQYAAGLMARGILVEQIHSYGFAFEGKKVWIGGGLLK